MTRLCSIPSSVLFLVALAAACEDRTARPAPEAPVAEPATAEPTPAEPRQGMNEQPAQPGQQAPTAQQAAPAAEQQGQGAAAAAGEIRSVADITGNPATFVGDNVTVRGEIEEVYQARSFKLDDQAVAKGGIDNDLIVLGAKGATWGVDKGWGQNEVRVTGTIRKVTIEDLERDLGWRPESELREALEGERVALVAERVERAPAE